MIPTITWELKQRKMVIFWWTICSVALIAMLLLVYPSIHSQAAQLNKVLAQLPEGLKAFKTGGSSADITTPIGFLNSQVFWITMPILWIILAITRGSSLLGKDEQNHTLELVLARPISRGKLLSAKAVSGMLEMLIVAAFSALTVLIIAPLVDIHIASSLLIITTFYTALFSLSFGVIAFALTALGRFTKRATSSLAVLLAFGGYIITTLAGMTHYLVNPAKVMPYHYFTPDKLLQGHYSLGLNIYLVGVLGLGVIVSWLGFSHRDLD